VPGAARRSGSTVTSTGLLDEHAGVALGLELALARVERGRDGRATTLTRLPASALSGPWAARRCALRARATAERSPTCAVRAAASWSRSAAWANALRAASGRRRGLLA
jgi:hypothetical protein